VARRGWMKQITGSAPAPRIVRPQLPAPPLPKAAATAEPDAEQIVTEVACEATLPQAEQAPETTATTATAEVVLGLAPQEGDPFSTDIQL
jgi:23S rRNA (guanosine2251-2'-O)-methyltransferase